MLTIAHPILKIFAFEAWLASSLRGLPSTMIIRYHYRDCFPFILYCINTKRSHVGLSFVFFANGLKKLLKKSPIFPIVFLLYYLRAAANFDDSWPHIGVVSTATSDAKRRSAPISLERRTLIDKETMPLEQVP